MRKLLVSIFALWFIISCKDPKKLSEQLDETIANHIKKIDSLVALDSIQIRYNVPVTEKVVRIMDDSGYSIQIRNTQAQLSRAKEMKDKDSIEFYQFELNYLNKVFDSVAKSIESSDTTRKFGRMISVVYYITKNKQSKFDSTLVFIDSVSRMVNTEFMEAALRRTITSLNY
jgi:hypothetical protein